MKHYTDRYKIYSFNCDHNFKATIQSLVEYMAETSIGETDDVMKGVTEYDDYFWIVYQWEIDIFDIPNYSDEINIETVSAGTKKFYAYRNFRVFDDNGKDYIKGKTKWLLLDRKTYMPTRIPDDLINRYGIEKDLDIVGKDLKIKKDVDYASSLSFSVRKTDIDANRHVNNAKYFGWIFESIDDEILDDNKLKKIEIVYKKDTKYGENIITKSTDLIQEDDDLVIYNKIEDEKGEVKTFSKLYF
ncbi:acyl-[acyl-carrier-protein] thioesterase [Miniphocaeibacter massiliensis]|uniref:acyl-[acyl-carrier-protein] thioesterase n=1 Tax=Miniphocaeibacter massiliensis TaxID=2041841 RepID=UPI000C0891AF|nr:acyl-ACP thioesterase domain-containing protein [Miniphocaeibacter massiliensis]